MWSPGCKILEFACLCLVLYTIEVFPNLKILNFNRSSIMNWRDISEICYGLVQEGKHPATLYLPEMFVTPYDKAIEILLKKGSSKEDVAKVVASSYMTDAADAVHRFNGLGEYQNYDWAKALSQAWMNEQR